MLLTSETARSVTRLDATIGGQWNRGLRIHQTANQGIARSVNRMNGWGHRMVVGCGFVTAPRCWCVRCLMDIYGPLLGWISSVLKARRSSRGLLLAVTSPPGGGGVWGYVPRDSGVLYHVGATVRLAFTGCAREVGGELMEKLRRNPRGSRRRWMRSQCWEGHGGRGDQRRRLAISRPPAASSASDAGSGITWNEAPVMVAELVSELFDVVHA